MAAFSLISGRCVNDNKTMKEINDQLSAPEQSGEMPSHPVTFVSNDEPSPMPWPNTWYPVTPIGPETEYPCPCSEGDSGTGSTDNNSVDFSIEFGRFPKWPELSGGRLMLNLNMMDAGLCWGTAFQYEHISQRRLEVTESAHASISRPEEPEDVSRAVVKTEKGFPRYYSFASPNVSGAEALGGTQMFQDRMRRVVVDGVSYLEEVQESGMTMRFRPNSSVFDHIVTPLGVKITFAELAAELQVVRQDAYDEPNMTVEAFNALSLFRLKQVWNKTDGLLDLSNVQNIKWYAPADVAERSNDGTYTVRDGAVPIKTWKLSWTFTDTETMIARAVDEENPEVTQMMLKTLRIEEPGGFISEWRAGLYPDDLTLVKGEGEDAISIVTRCRPANGHENMIAKDVNGQSMVAGGYYTDKKEKFKYVYSGVAGTENAVLCSAEKEVYQRRLYGDVLVSRTEGYETPLERTWTYGYGSDPSSPNYGKRIRETRPDGAVIQMEYDSNGNVIQQTEPWYGDIQKKINYTYSSEKFNDRRLLQEHVVLISGGETYTLEMTVYEYGESHDIVTETKTSSFLGRNGNITIKRSWYRAHDTCVYAQGRLCREEWTSGKCITYEYALNSLHGAVWACIETLLENNSRVETSERTIRYYMENGDEVAIDHQVYVEKDGSFVSVDFQQMDYDASHRVIRTDYANGLFSTAEWSCSGPLWETDVQGLQNRYEYDGAKRLVRTERDAAPFAEDWNEGMNMPCPDSIMEMTYNGSGLMLSAIHSKGESKTMVTSTYDMLGRLVSRTDEMGRITWYSYSGDGLTVTETIPSGATLVTRKTPSGLVVEESGTGREARYYSYGVSDSGVLKRTMLSSSSQVVEESTLDGRGRLTYLHRFRNGSMVQQYWANYDSDDNMTNERIGNNWPVEYHYDVISGAPYYWVVMGKSLTNSRWGEDRVRFTFLKENIPGLDIDVKNMVFRENRTYTQADGIPAIEQYSYELISQKNESFSGLVSLSLHKNAYGRWSWKKVYHERGNIRILSGREGCSGEREEIRLNGELVRLTEPDGSVIRYSRVYNATGDTFTIRDSRGNDTLIINDTIGREVSRTDQDGKVTTTAYDPATGLPFCVTTPDGKQAFSTYDSRGRLVSRYGNAVRPMKWEYDGMDHIVALHTWRFSGSTLNEVPSSGSDITRWSYDVGTNDLLSKTYADGSCVRYSYDDWGRVISRKRAGGVVSTYKYEEAVGKVKSITHSDGTPSVSIVYDAMGRVSSIQDASGTRSIAYTSLGDAASETTSGSVASVLSYQCDSIGRPSGYVLLLNDKVVQQVTLEYDSKDRISLVSLNGCSFTYGYDEMTGWLNSLGYPNGIVRQTAFHANLPLVSSLTYVKDSSTVPMIKHAYTWDNMQRPSTREDYVDSSTFSRRHMYCYNARGELVEDMMSTGGAFRYTYDNIGNRQTVVKSGFSSSYDSTNLNSYKDMTRASVVFTPMYDADGNQTKVNTSSGIWSIQYNADNRPVIFIQGKKRVECVYDYLGRRVEKVEYDGNNLTRRTRFTYMGYLMVASMDCTQNISNPLLLGTWFWDPLEPMATRVLAMCTYNADKSIVSTRYVAHDLLKNVSALFDSSGIRRAKFEYTPYGEMLTTEGEWASTMPFRYSNEYCEEDLGLVYYNYRHYNPKDGRWISRDSIGEEDDVNLYGFVFGSPSRNVDGLGLKCQDQSQTVTLILERKTEWPGMGIYGSLTEDIPEHIACKCGKIETILTMELPSKGKKARSRKSLKNPSYYSGLAQRTSGDVSLKQPSSTSTHSFAPDFISDQNNPSLGDQNAVPVVAQGFSLSEQDVWDSTNQGIRLYDSIMVHYGEQPFHSGGCLLVGTNYKKVGSTLEPDSIAPVSSEERNRYKEFNMDYTGKQRTPGWESAGEVWGFDAVDSLTTQLLLTIHIKCIKKNFPKANIKWNRIGNSVPSDQFGDWPIQNHSPWYRIQRFQYPKMQ